MAGVRSPCGGFQVKSFAFSSLKTLIKDANVKGKFNRMLICLFVDERKLFITKLSLEEFNLVFFTAECLARFEPFSLSSFRSCRSLQ